MPRILLMINLIIFIAPVNLIAAQTESPIVNIISNPSLSDTEVAKIVEIYKNGKTSGEDWHVTLIKMVAAIDETDVSKDKKLELYFIVMYSKFYLADSVDETALVLEGLLKEPPSTQELASRFPDDFKNLRNKAFAGVLEYYDVLYDAVINKLNYVYTALVFRSNNPTSVYQKNLGGDESLSSQVDIAIFLIKEGKRAGIIKENTCKLWIEELQKPIEEISAKTVIDMTITLKAQVKNSFIPLKNPFYGWLNGRFATEEDVIKLWNNSITDAENAPISTLKAPKFNEDEFKKIAVMLLYHEYGDALSEFNTDQLASAWIDMILGFMNKEESTAIFSAETDPYIDIEDARSILEPNGLFAYLTNKINSLPQNSDVRTALQAVFYAINGRILADLNKAAYKDLVIPEVYKYVPTALTNYYSNLDLVETVLATLLLKDLEQGAQDGVTTKDLRNKKPILYTQASIYSLIEMAYQEKQLDKARDLATKVNQLIEELPKNNSLLSNKVTNLSLELSKRPKRILVKELRKMFDFDFMNSDDIILVGLEYLVKDIRGIMIDGETTRLTFGTAMNNFEDGLLYQAFVMSNTNVNARDRADEYLKTLRLLILCNNNSIKLETGEEMNVVNFFLQDSMLNFTLYYLGIETPTNSYKTIDAITEADFKSNSVHIANVLRLRGIERFKQINDGLMLKK